MRVRGFEAFANCSSPRSALIVVRSVALEADPEKKASVRNSYKADPEKKKASVRDSYNADIESKQSAKGSDIERTSRRTVLLKGSDIKRTSRRTALLKGRNTRTIRLPLRHLKGIGIGMTPLSDWLNVLTRGSGIAGVTELPLPPKDAVLPPYRPLPAVAALPSPPPAAAAAAAAALPTPPAAGAEAAGAEAAGAEAAGAEAAGAPLQYWHQCPHHHFACCHPGRCHHHPHGSHGLNQAAEVRDEAWGEEEDKPGEPYSTLKTHILIISIIKLFNLPPFEN
ncbi:hypothetical protein EMCRGX_G029393 [Ephydatia muelleri]